MSKNSYLEQVARGLIKLSTPASRAVAAVMTVMYLIILDRSGSMATPCGRENRLEAAKKAALAMLDAREQLGADDQIAVIAFNHQARLVLPFTRCAGKRSRIERAIRSIEIGGGTDLKAPLARAKKIRPSDGCVHIVMLTDGHGGSPVRAAKVLKDAGVVIETVGVGDHPSEVDESILKKTASVLNGKVLYRFLSDADEMIQYFRTDIANRLVKLD